MADRSRQRSMPLADVDERVHEWAVPPIGVPVFLNVLDGRATHLDPASGVVQERLDRLDELIVPIRAAEKAGLPVPHGLGNAGESGCDDRNSPRGRLNPREQQCVLNRRNHEEIQKRQVEIEQLRVRDRTVADDVPRSGRQVGNVAEDMELGSVLPSILVPAQKAIATLPRPRVAHEADPRGRA